MLRILIIIFALSHLAGCVSQDPRGQWWGLGHCTNMRDGASFCAAKTRGWGEL